MGTWFWQVGLYRLHTTVVEFGMGSPTLVNLTKFAGTGLILKDLAKITVGMVSPYIFVVVCIFLSLVDSLVAMHGHVTCVLA